MGPPVRIEDSNTEPRANHEPLPANEINGFPKEEPIPSATGTELTVEEPTGTEASLAEINAIQATTVLPDKPRLGIMERFPLRQQSTFEQISASKVRFNYDVSLKKDGVFAALTIQFDNFGTEAIETADLSQLDEITFGLASNNTCGASRICLKIEFVDANGRKAVFGIRNISTMEQFFTIPKAFFTKYFPKFRLDQVRFVNFIYDRSLTKSGTRQGYLEVTTGGLYFEPPILPDTGPVTDLVAYRPSANEMEPLGRDTVTDFVQTSTDQFYFDYNLANGQDADFSRWAGAILSFLDHPYDLTAQDLVFALSAAGTSRIKIVVSSGIGANEKKVVLIAENVTGTPQFYRITSALLASAEIEGFDPTNITFISFVVDDVNANSLTASGRVTVDTRNIYYPPALVPDVGPVTDLTPELPVVTAIEPNGRDTVTSFTQASSDQFSFDINLANGEDADFSRWGGALMSFFTNPFDLTQEDLVFGIRSTIPGGKMKFELISGTGANERKVTLIADNLTSSAQFFRITRALVESAGVQGFDPSDIRFVSFIVDAQTAGSPTAQGTVTIDTQGLFFVPSLAPNPALTASNISNLPGIFSLSAFDSNPPNPEGTVTSNQISTTRFNVTYDLPNEDSFGGSITSFDNFGTPGVEFQDLSGQTIVLGLRDPGSPSQVILQLEDANGNRDQVYLTGVDATERFFEVQTSLFDEVDLTRTTAMVIVLEEDRLLDPTSTLEVRLGNYPPVASPVIASPNSAPVPYTPPSSLDLSGRKKKKKGNFSNLPEPLPSLAL